MLGEYKNIDRRIQEPDLEPIDVLLLTLDEETYLEKCLDSVYQEIPVNKVIAVDGGSKDRTVEILKKYPRMEIHVRPDIKTSGKSCEFAFSQATTHWLAIIEAHIELPTGWYDEMVKHRNEYDFFGCKRINHYEFERVDPTSLDINKRPMGAPWLASRDCLKNYHVDDDYMWRATDILLRQVVEKDGYKFGKINTTFHYHHTTDNLMYESDAEKRGSRLVFKEPEMEILDQKNWEKRQDDFRRAVVKYIDPEFIYPCNDQRTLLLTLLRLDMEWVKETNLKWYQVLAGAKLARKKTLIKKLRIVAWHTTGFLASVKKDFHHYWKQINESLK